MHSRSLCGALSMRIKVILAAAVCGLVWSTSAPAQPVAAATTGNPPGGVAAPAAKAASAASRVVAVTVYQGNALVTREVDVPAGQGLVEVVVTPLPPQTVDSSLYTEGADGVRVLSTRYRTRAVKEDTRKEVRAKEEQIRTLKQEAERLQKEVKANEQNLQFLDKLENFTAATMQNLADKGSQ